MRTVQKKRSKDGESESDHVTVLGLIVLMGAAILLLGVLV